FNLLEDETRLENFHRLLKANLLSGVAIYTSFYMSEIPDSFIQLAHEQHLPLIEIPVDINFSEITKEILAQLVNQQAHILTQSEIIHHELTKLVLNDKSLQEVTKRLAQLTSSQIVIYNQFYDIMYHNQDFHPTEELFFSNTILTHHNQSVDLSNDLLRSLDKESKVNIMLDASIVTVYPIIAKQSCFGWIVLFKSKATWNEIDDIAIGRASTIYAMEFLKKQAVEETRIRMQSSLLEDIIHVTKDKQDLVTEQILKLDYDITKQQSVLSITCKQEGMLDFQMMDRLYYLIENICMQKNKQHIIQAKAQSIVLLTNVIGESEEEQYQHLQQLAQEIIETWEFYFPKINLMIGIGNCYDDLFEISLSAQQANYALKLYPLIDDAIQIIHYEDLGMYDF